MNSKLWIRKALSMCLCVAMLASYSMVALAGAGKAAGELTVSGSADNMVTVNGEAAKTGRTIFSTSTVATPDGASAVINLGKLGAIELAPNSAMTLSFDDKSISSELTAGKLTVLSASNGVSVKTTGGETFKLSAGESAAASGKAQDDDDDDDNGGGAAWWGFALIFGGAAVGIIWAATQSDNRVELGGTGTVVSPIR